MQGEPEQSRVFAYNGEQYTPQTGLQYLRARHYDPQLGAFTTRDTYLGDLKTPISQNRYTYAHNNPVRYADPSGHRLHVDGPRGPGTTSPRNRSMIGTGAGALTNPPGLAALLRTLGGITGAVSG